MSRSRSHSRSRSRSHSHRGAGFATGPSYVSAGNLEIMGNRSASGPDCLAASRPMVSAGYGGLPGMRGGVRRKQGGSRKARIHGGRYGISLADSVLDASRGVVGGIPQAVRIPCEASRTSGGAFPVIDVGRAADAMAYHTPTAGYGNEMTKGGNVPLMIQAPYAAKACVGGRRSRKGKSHKGKSHRGRSRR